MKLGVFKPSEAIHGLCVSVSSKHRGARTDSDKIEPCCRVRLRFTGARDQVAAANHPVVNEVENAMRIAAQPRLTGPLTGTVHEPLVVPLPQPAMSPAAPLESIAHVRAGADAVRSRLIVGDSGCSCGETVGAMPVVVAPTMIPTLGATMVPTVAPTMAQTVE